MGIEERKGELIKKVENFKKFKGGTRDKFHFMRNHLGRLPW